MRALDSYAGAEEESEEVLRNESAVQAAPSLRFANETDFAALQDFRACIFRDELGIQAPLSGCLQ